MTQVNYHHTQSAMFLTGLLFLVVCLLVLIVWPATQNFVQQSLLAALVLVFGLLGLWFSSLTVSVTESDLMWCFGFGFWKKAITRTEITKVEAVKTKWWYGWGIRFTPKGWLYNVSGFDAVAVGMRNGKTVLIGTDEPDALIAALRS